MKTTDKVKFIISTTNNMNNKSIYNIPINSLDGKPISLIDFRGKKVIFVNVASKCGFTKQYKELQELSDKYSKELVVIGLPCNQFGKQESGTPSEIQEFCKLNFGVTFLLTEKIDVKGSKQHPLYTWLTTKELNGKNSTGVKWNFQKYLIDENGNFIDYFLSITKPMSFKITRHL